MTTYMLSCNWILAPRKPLKTLLVPNVQQRCRKTLELSALSQAVSLVHRTLLPKGRMCRSVKAFFFSSLLMPFVRLDLGKTAATFTAGSKMQKDECFRKLGTLLEAIEVSFALPRWASARSTNLTQAVFSYSCEFYKSCTTWPYVSVH